MSNDVKHVLLFCIMMCLMIGVATIDLDLYRNILVLVGSWQIGRWFSNYACTRWPRKGIDD